MEAVWKTTQDNAEVNGAEECSTKDPGRIFTGLDQELAGWVKGCGSWDVAVGSGSEGQGRVPVKGKSLLSGAQPGSCEGHMGRTVPAPVLHQGVLKLRAGSRQIKGWGWEAERKLLQLRGL